MHTIFNFAKRGGGKGKRMMIAICLVILSSCGRSGHENKKSDKNLKAAVVQCEKFYRFVYGSDIDSAVYLFAACPKKYFDTLRVIELFSEMKKLHGVVHDLKLANESEDSVIAMGIKTDRIIVEYELKTDSGTKRDIFTIFLFEGQDGKFKSVIREDIDD